MNCFKQIQTAILNFVNIFNTVKVMLVHFKSIYKIKIGKKKINDDKGTSNKAFMNLLASDTTNFK